MQSMLGLASPTWVHISPAFMLLVNTSDFVFKHKMFLLSGVSDLRVRTESPHPGTDILHPGRRNETVRATKQDLTRCLRSLIPCAGPAYIR